MKIITLILFFFTSIHIHANEEALVKQFFDKKGIKDKQSVYAGELLTHYLDKPTLGETLPDNTRVDYHVLQHNNNKSIYTVNVSNGNISQNWYIYLEKYQETWKITAVRTLALPGLFFIALQELANKQNRTDEEEFQYQNMLLTIKSDIKLKDYLKQNIVIFNKVAELSKSNPTAANKLAKTLHINSIQFEKDSGITDISIGGMLDNTVGYLYIPKGSKIPVMSPNDYIYIEKITENWFIYKTT